MYCEDLGILLLAEESCIWETKISVSGPQGVLCQENKLGCGCVLQRVSIENLHIPNSAVMSVILHGIVDRPN